MENMVRYVCPQDEDSILFEAVARPIIRSAIPDPPARCPKCGRSYYRWECKEKKEEKE